MNLMYSKIQTVDCPRQIREEKWDAGSEGQSAKRLRVHGREGRYIEKWGRAGKGRKGEGRAKLEMMVGVRGCVGHGRARPRGCIGDGMQGFGLQRREVIAGVEGGRIRN